MFTHPARLRGVCIFAALTAGAIGLCPPAHAGNIYGSLWLGGKPASGARIEIACTLRYPTTSAADGSYRIVVPERRRCIFRVTVGDLVGETEIASYENAIKYDFDLYPQGKSLILKRR